MKLKSIKHSKVLKEKKHLAFLFLLLNLYFISYSQKPEANIISESNKIQINYAPKEVFSNFSIAFQNLSNDYGIKLSFVLSEKFDLVSMKPFFDSFTMIFPNKKKIVLKSIFKDSMYYQFNGSLCYEIALILKPEEYEMFKEKNLISIQGNNSVFDIRIRRKSQEEIINLLNSF